jgi:hypothetical protein
VIVPVGELPLASVAVSEIDAPATTGDVDATVVMVGTTWMTWGAADGMVAEAMVDVNANGPPSTSTPATAALIQRIRRPLSDPALLSVNITIAPLRRASIQDYLPPPLCGSLDHLDDVRQVPCLTGTSRSFPAVRV